MPEITIKDLYDIINQRINGLETEVREYNRSFVRFEEGKVSMLIERVTRLEEEKKSAGTIIDAKYGTVQRLFNKLLDGIFIAIPFTILMTILIAVLKVVFHIG